MGDVTYDEFFNYLSLFYIVRDEVATIVDLDLNSVDDAFNDPLPKNDDYFYSKLLSDGLLDFY